MADDDPPRIEALLLEDRSCASPTSDMTAWVVTARPVRRAARAAARMDALLLAGQPRLVGPDLADDPGRTPVPRTPAVALADELVGQVVDRALLDARLGG